MKFNISSMTLVFAATLAIAAPISAAQGRSDPSIKLAAANRTWRFTSQANNIFQDMQRDAQQAANHADRLQSFAFEPLLSRTSHDSELSAIKAEVNDMTAKLSILQVNRYNCAPWQQAVIDQIAATMPLMVDNTQDAIVFASSHSNTLWLGTYRRYSENIYNESQTVENCLSKAVSYAHVSREYKNLQRQLTLPANS